MPRWSEQNIGDQSGKTFIITGANSGLGLEATRMLAQHGADVVMACRNVEKADAAAESVRQLRPSGTLTIAQVDMASLESIGDFSERVLAAHARIDGLINNAGLMAIPRRETADGFEMQLGTNHLGHFALTGRLLPLLLSSAPTRVVTVSSGLHARGRMNFDDLQSESSYDKWAAYSQSKLANLLFAFELQRKLQVKYPEVLSLGAHPGYAATNLQQVGPQMAGSKVRQVGMRISNLFAQSAAMGALPLVYGAVASDLKGGEYVGPRSFGGFRGYPERCPSSRRAQSLTDAATLWRLSTELTGQDFAALN